ncbi:MAG: hypothetical protein GXO71_04395, partial [Caldiserica bacterium]|nr:hypothetical protein [Caldisericota bacterium]
MPHPERAAWLRQIPDDLDSSYAEKKRECWGNISRMRSPGPGYKIFSSLLSPEPRRVQGK